MPLHRMFIKAKIECMKSLYIATITYSYYGIYHFEEVDVFESIVDAEKHLLFKRCGGLIQYDINSTDNTTTLQPKKQQQPDKNNPVKFLAK